MTVRRLAVFIVLALVAPALALFASTRTEGQTYRPSQAYSLANPAPGVPSDSLISFSIAAPDYNYEDASMVSFSPPDGWTANGAYLPMGAKVGVVNASATIGLLGGPCNAALNPSFTLWNASVDILDQLYDTSWILKPAGTNPVPDTDGDGLHDYLEQYPWFLNDMLDPDGSGPQLPYRCGRAPVWRATPPWLSGTCSSSSWCSTPASCRSSPVSSPRWALSWASPHSSS